MVRRIAYRAVDGIPKTLEYSLVRSSRKTIGISVHPNGKVMVRTPMHVSSRQVEEALNRKLNWILKHKQNFEKVAKKIPRKNFITGEKHHFLGDEYTLRVKGSTGSGSNVVHNGSFIDVYCEDKSQVEFLLKQWYHAEAKEKLPEIILPLLHRFKESYNIAPGKISIKWLKSRWGSCSSRGSISLNSKLVKSPERCIEYVFAHELCHLIHFNHSKKFYDLLSQFMPDWKKRKQELNATIRYSDQH